MAGASLRGAVFTPADTLHSKNSGGSFLDLATAEGLDSADCGDATFLPSYLEEAFSYAHQEGLHESETWPNFVKTAIQSIELLQEICYIHAEPPKQLIQACHNITLEVMNHLKRHPLEMSNLRPRQFEQLIAEILSFYGWEVQLTRSTKDGGYDIYALSPTTAKGISSSWLIECKKYSKDNKKP